MRRTAHSTSVEAIRDWLTRHVAELLDRPVELIEPDVPLAQYGLDSVYALTVTTAVEDTFGVLLEPTVMWDHPTIDGVSRVLAASLAEAGAAPPGAQPE